MDKDVFGAGRQIPPLIETITSAHCLEEMTPGETTWTDIHILKRDEEQRIFIDTRYSQLRRHETPNSRFATIKVIKDFDGVYLDLTALSREDIERGLDTAHITDEDMSLDDEQYTQVDGVLYPDIAETSGLDPADVQAFNQEQARIRQKFADYYERTYRETYVFAGEELPSTGFRRRRSSHSISRSLKVKAAVFGRLGLLR